MKRALPLILAAFMALGLCACAESGAPGEPESIQIVEKPDYVPELSDAESAAMSAFMNKNRALIYDGALYSLEFDGEYKPVLAKYTAEGEYSVLAEDCVPEFLTAYGGRLYYINSRRGSVIESIAPDGTERQTLTGEGCGWLEIYGGELYFSDSEARYRHMQPDGSGDTLLLQGPCYYPYIFDGHVIYQDGRDECLYLADVSTGDTLRLSYVPAYAPVIIGSELYASERTEAGYGVYKLDFESGTAKSYEEHILGSAAELYISGGDWQLRYPDSDGRQYSLSLTALNGEARDCGYAGYRRVEYFTGEYLVESEYEPNSRIRAFVICGADGAETKYMTGTVGGQSENG